MTRLNLNVDLSGVAGAGDALAISHLPDGLELIDPITRVQLIDDVLVFSNRNGAKIEIALLNGCSLHLHGLKCGPSVSGGTSDCE